MTRPSGQIDVPVLIVGGGPVGLTASILLSQHGIRSLLAELRRKVFERGEVALALVELPAEIGRAHV